MSGRVKTSHNINLILSDPQSRMLLFMIGGSKKQENQMIVSSNRHYVY